MNIAKTVLATLLLGICALALARKETLYNEHYIGPDENQAWEEQAVPLPAYPAGNQQWIDVYINQTYSGHPKLLLNSISINPDRTVHYILNQQSAQGINNLSAEAIHCPTRRMKVFGFGDDVNKRWIQPRNGQWKVIGTSLNELDRVRSVLYQTFCEDGLPRNHEELMQRITTRAMR